MSTIKLQSGDNKIFDVNIQVVKCSDKIVTILEDQKVEETEREVIPLPNVKGAVLRKILEWATYHKDDHESAAISQWDREFLQVEQGLLFELMLAANYLGIEALEEMTRTTVANMIKGKTPDQIRQTFNIENDLSPEEEQQILVENECIEEL